jgi:hypothetical protein
MRSNVGIEEISKALEKAKCCLEDNGIETETVGPQDLIAFFDGEAPSGDTATLRDITEQRWLMIHEIVEISELRRRKLDISVLTLRSHPHDVSECHLIATKTEFTLARQDGDHEWLRQRVPLIRSWRNDDGMTNRMWTEYLALENEFKEYLQR